MNDLPGPMVVLYVDPNAEARAARGAWLRRLDATLHEAADAEAAVAVAQSLEQLDVLVTEGWLGEQFSGVDLRDAVQQRFPEVRTVFTSRYDLSHLESEIGTCPVFYEPVEEGKLVSAVSGGAMTSVLVTSEAVVTTETSAVAVAAPEPAAPVPTPAPAPTPQAQGGGGEVAKAVVVEEEEAPPVLEPGAVLGSYEIKERMYAEPDTETYLAVQQGIGRKVALVLLKPELVSNSDEVEKFKERERVKAAIEHPRIAPLYEAMQIGPHYFYTREMPHGRTVEELQGAGVKFGEKNLVDLIANVCDAMAHATLRGHVYRMLTARDVSVDGEHQASIVNLFRAPGGRQRDHVADVKKFLMMMRTLAEGPKARHLMDDLARESRDWEGMRQRAAELQEEFREHSLLKRADTKEAQDIQASRQKSPLPLWAFVVTGVLVLALVIGLVWRNLSAPPPPPPALKASMVPVKGAEFLYQRGENRRLSDFWIDKHEVTIGQYAEFLDALKKEEKKDRYDHEDQPENKKNHRPEGWEAYLQAALTAGSFNGQPININCPVVRVDWWDAYAYAKWRGNRLPTEEEWERAARGTDGRSYPWGNESRPEAANLGGDYNSKGSGGNIDGFNFSAPVDKMPLDVTPEGVAGMAGNVEEWTGSWGTHPDFPDLQVPIARGGSFEMALAGDALTLRTFSQSPKDASYARGFRTVRDSAPPTDAKEGK